MTLEEYAKLLEAFEQDPCPRTLLPVKDNISKLEGQGVTPGLAVNLPVVGAWIRRNRSEIGCAMACIAWEDTLNAELYWTWIHRGTAEMMELDSSNLNPPDTNIKLRIWRNPQ